MINKPIAKDKEAAFIRNRNLFYVCCSRPKKRLIIFISVLLKTEFKESLIEMCGKDNILTYQEYISKSANI